MVELDQVIGNVGQGAPTAGAVQAGFAAKPRLAGLLMLTSVAAGCGAGLALGHKITPQGYARSDAVVLVCISRRCWGQRAVRLRLAAAVTLRSARAADRRARTTSERERPVSAAILSSAAMPASLMRTATWGRRGPALGIVTGAHPGVEADDRPLTRQHNRFTFKARYRNVRDAMVGLLGLGWISAAPTSIAEHLDDPAPVGRVDGFLVSPWMTAFPTHGV